MKSNRIVNMYANRRELKLIDKINYSYLVFVARGPSILGKLHFSLLIMYMCSNSNVIASSRYSFFAHVRLSSLFT